MMDWTLNKDGVAPIMMAPRGLISVLLPVSTRPPAHTVPLMWELDELASTRILSTARMSAQIVRPRAAAALPQLQIVGCEIGGARAGARTG